jgi:drug/metabolite transporter (DMT)-like permease
MSQPISKTGLFWRLSLSHAAKGRLFLFLTAILFSTGGAAIKACSLTSWQTAGFRSGIAAVVLYLLLPGARPSRKRRWTRSVWLTGFAYAATLILFVLSTKLTTAANAIFLQSTAPLYLLLLGPLVLREPIRKIDLVVIAIVAAGAALLLSGSDATTSTAPDPSRGNAMALAAGLAWALTLTGLRWMGKRPEHGNSSEATVIVGNLIAFAACMPMALPIGHARIADIAVLLYLGIFQIAVAYVLLTWSLRQVTGLEAATVLLIEPVLNPIWTWMIHGERPSAEALWGGVLIITAAFAGTVWRVKFSQT